MLILYIVIRKSGTDTGVTRLPDFLLLPANFMCSYCNEHKHVPGNIIEARFDGLKSFTGTFFARCRGAGLGEFPVTFGPNR